jgi:putative inorganic carbon (hco3(-)) transporter
MNTPVLAGLQPLEPASPRRLLARTRENWAFLAFVALIPLQNLYSGYFPDLGGGLNFLNLMFTASLLLAWRAGGGLVRGGGLNGWVWTYIAMSLLAVAVSAGQVLDSSGHLNILKDQLIAVAFLFLAQMSATDRGSVRRLLLASLLPLPYLLLVVIDQHQAVDSWHYSHDLRIAGTFSDLGANELAAFCTTALLVSLGLLLGVRCGARWRIGLLAAIGCTAIGITLTYSRTAYVAVLGGIAVIVLLRRGGMRLLLPVLLVAALLPALLPVSVLERFDSISVAEGERDESTENRFQFWAMARQRFAEHPLLGTGFHSFQHPEINPGQRDTHNLYLRELSEKGLLGGLVLLGLLASTGRLLWRALRRAEPGGWTFGLALGLCGAFAALLCNNLFGDRFTHYPMIAHYWLYLGLLLRSLALDAEAADAA